VGTLSKPLEEKSLQGSFSQVASCQKKKKQNNTLYCQYAKYAIFKGWNLLKLSAFPSDGKGKDKEWVGSNPEKSQGQSRLNNNKVKAGELIMCR